MTNETDGISQRVQGIKISATKLMPMLAAEVGGCVSLGQGVPSFATPEPVIQALFNEIRTNPAATRYSLQPGVPALRKAVADQLRQEKNIYADPEAEVAITAGAMEGLLCAMLTIVERGDEVLIPEPFYPSHVEQILLAEGKPVFAPLHRDDWGLNIPVMRKFLTPLTKAIVINSPHNPTGAVFDEEDLRSLAYLALDHNLYIICDDTYDFLVYNGKPAFSLASIPELRDRLILVSSFSKRYALTGWRVGFVHSCKVLMDQMLKVHDCTAICAPTPSQYAALAALQGPQDIYTQFRDTLRERRDLLCARLDALSGYFSYIQPQGAFYVMAKYLFTKADSMEVAERLIHEAKVVTIPGGSFGHGGEHSLRLSFGGTEEEINEAFDRIEGWLK